jgi:hypothetical protein
MTAYKVAFIVKNKDLLIRLPKYMKKTEVHDEILSIDNWPTTNVELRKIAHQALSSRLEDTNQY